MEQGIPVAETRVLSTLHEDGSRRWLHPRLSRGRFLRARRVLAYLLIAVFTLLPYLRIGGKPAVLLNIPAREFSLFGFTFLPTDTLLLALFLVTAIVGIILATALAGRVWCGWMCPQTVYLEFVYRPLERLFDGPPGVRHAKGKQGTPLRTVAKFALYAVVSVFLAHTFLAYFVGVEDLVLWVRRSPLEHPAPFLVMLAVSGLMMFNFSYFREQTCLVACPYGRFQSVMLDRDSLIVSYDPRRGEPRGRGAVRFSSRKEQPGSGESVEPGLGQTEPRGDCIDCGMCVDTCPTGIDIRDGLQMECVACTQCIDACDGVMDRLGRSRGLIRFSSQARIAGQPSRLLRPRVILYPAILLGLVTAFGFVLARKESADVTLLRGLGLPFTELAPGEITNSIRVKIRNRSREPETYRVEAVDPEARLTSADEVLEVSAGGARTETVLITVPRSVFRNGTYEVTLRVSDEEDYRREFKYRLLGPQSAPTDAAPPVQATGDAP
jgi:cytochrome c oxidase accessory protein FixG